MSGDRASLASGSTPLAVWCANTDEPLAAMLWPGNAAPENTGDHLEVLEQELRAVPSKCALGNEEGDHLALVIHPVLVRADSAGTTHRFVQTVTDANFEYSIGNPVSGAVRDTRLLPKQRTGSGERASRRCEQKRWLSTSARVPLA